MRFRQQLENGETVHFLRPPTLAGTEFLFAHQNSHHWRVFHERYAVCTCETADAHWRYRRRSHLLNDGSYSLLEPGEVHVTYQVNKRSNFQVLFLDPDFIARTAADIGLAGFPHLKTAQGDNPEFFRAFQQLFASVQNNEAALEQESRLAVCVHLLLKRYAERSPCSIPGHAPHRAIERARAYLCDRFNEPVSLEELAAVAGLSRFHLLRAFARYTGLPPHAYQIRIRIERARRLLQAGMSPGNAALTVGFADQSHFARNFKRVLNVTPGRYARMTIAR